MNNEEVEQFENSSELLTVKLFFENKPKLNDDVIERELKERFNNFELSENSDSPDYSKHYVFHDYQAKYADGSMPAQATMFVTDNDSIDYSELSSSFEQSWNWPEAEEIMTKCSYEILITDLMSRGLCYKERIEYFQKFVSSIVSALKPQAIWIKSSEMFINPTDFLEISSQNNYANISGFINVRLYNIQETEGEMIMDTLGLHSLGLPDFEFRFANYEPQQVAGLLFSYAHYIFENGVVIEDGNTIQGIDENSILTCSFKHSQLEPKRIVIEINGDD